MKIRSFICIILLLSLCLGLTGCLDDVPVSLLPEITSGHNLHPTTVGFETTAPGESHTGEVTLSPNEATILPIIEPTTEPVHLHEYLAATCTAPKTCASCGETTGSPLGHKWKEATCSEPKTCSVCGATTGLTAGHNFQNGNCTACGKADPDSGGEVMVWIPTKGGTKYHRKPSCSKMIDPEQVSQSEAERRGFTPCKKCYK